MTWLYWLIPTSVCLAAWAVPDMYQWRFALRGQYRYSVGIVFAFCLGGVAGAWLGG